ncbi:hypothetical protein GOP47_0024955 [Adiantum capillus-veneris]|uniref:Uncharacterized protein n=1 Tax=Adiantum capillus-veneris TaxID=13818 RepID=A0A9D4Z442_ADICA|nr:hypothetical protein GOP47_0024955 [Adiantum capillus-veneris]
MSSIHKLLKGQGCWQIEPHRNARQQAQEMSEKVNNLHIRLETEIKHRKEAEAAMVKVFLALKAKGVLMDRVLLFPTDLNGNSTGDASPSDYGEGAKELSGEVPCSPIQHGKGERDESSTQSMGILECVTELHGSLSVVEGTEDTNGTSDAPGANPVERKARVPLRDIAEHPHRCLMEHDHDKKEVCQDHRMLDGTPIVKGDIGTGQSIQQGLCITTKLKALLQQIEEEVGALPEEQPLRAKLQGVAGHLANMLDRGQEAGLESYHVESSNQPEIINSSSERVTAPEAKNCTHMEEGIDRRERLAKRLFSSPKAQLQRRPLMSSTSTLSTPSMENTFLESNAFYE